MQDAAQVTLLPALPESHSFVNWEWFWRFLALVLFISTSWVIWVLIEMNPNPLATPAAFAAAAHAAQGRISPAPSAEVARPESAVLAEPGVGSPASGTPGVIGTGAPAQGLAPGPIPPVDLRRLKRSDTLSLVPPENSRSSGKGN